MKTYFYALDCWIKQTAYMQEYIKMFYYIGNNSQQQYELLANLNNALLKSTNKLLNQGQTTRGKINLVNDYQTNLNLLINYEIKTGVIS